MKKNHLQSALALLVILVAGSEVLQAQPFILSTTPEGVRITGATAVFRTTASTQLGFGASIFFSAECPTLPLASIDVTPEILNMPYTDTVITTITLTGPKEGGRHKVIITASNGPAVVHDTVIISIPDRSAWRVFTKDEFSGDPRQLDIFHPNRNYFGVDRETGIGWFLVGDTLKSFDGADWQVHAWPDTNDIDTLYRNPLVDASVEGIALDPEGRLWGAIVSGWKKSLVVRERDGSWNIIGRLDSARGRDRFLDGILFYHYYSSNLRVLQFGPDGKVWIPGAQGPVLYDTDSTWTYYSTETTDLPNWDRELLVDLYGNVWINPGQISGLIKFDGQYFTSWSPGDLGIAGSGFEARPIAADANGYTWFRAHNTTLRMDGETNEQHKFFYPTLQGDPIPGMTHESFFGHQITSLDIGRDGDTWISLKTFHYQFGSTFEGGIARYDGTDWYHYTISNSGLPSNEVIALEVDDNNQVWIITEDGSLTILDGTLPPTEAFTGDISTVSNSSDKLRTIDMSLSPNPATSKVIVSLQAPGLIRSGEVVIYNAQGTEVRRISDRPIASGTITLDLEGLPAGPYFVRLEGSAGVHASAALLITP